MCAQILVFQRYGGAVAQTRRVLLAKQLIHETHVPMAEVAFAAGFRERPMSMSMSMPMSMPMSMSMSMSMSISIRS
jgi:hypothetical protein